MREKNETPRMTVRGASTGKEGPEDHQSLSDPQDTAPAPYCRCPRQGDLWLCAGRPALERDPAGNQCALGATIRLTGRDIDPRTLLARTLKEDGPRE